MRKSSPARASIASGLNPAAVYVSTVPAELIVTRGEPTYIPIPKTQLLYVTNSDYDIFMDTPGQEYFTLLAGRWRRVKSFEGTWRWVGEQLPHDVSKIALDIPKGHVLASTPGTGQARDVIANRIPQAATVRPSEAKSINSANGRERPRLPALGIAPFTLVGAIPPRGV